jgi:Cu(I)/Ag(I) efflux system membrane protein CusA/SilA
MKRIAAPMVGGLLTSAFLTLEIIPVIYTGWRYEELVRSRLRAAAPALDRELDRFVWMLRGGLALSLLAGALYVWTELSSRIVGPVAAGGLSAVLFGAVGYAWARHRVLRLTFGSAGTLPALPSTRTPDGESHA